jgi:hypothetical protein
MYIIIIIIHGSHHQTPSINIIYVCHTHHAHQAWVRSTSFLTYSSVFLIIVGNVTASSDRV